MPAHSEREVTTDGLRRAADAFHDRVDAAQVDLAKLRCRTEQTPLDDEFIRLSEERFGPREGALRNVLHRRSGAPIEPIGVEADDRLGIQLPEQQEEPEPRESKQPE